MNYRILFILVFVFTLSVNAFAASKKNEESIGKVAAIIKNEIITNDELNEQVKNARSRLLQMGHEPPSQAILRKQVLNQMIYQTIQLIFAKKINMDVSDVELDQAINSVAQSNHLTLKQLKTSIETQGLTFKKYREELKKQLLIQKLQQEMVAKEIKINPDEVKKVEKQLASKAGAVQEYHLLDILIPLPETPTSSQVLKAKEQAKRIIKKAQQGEDFKKLAISESGAHNALHGGDFGWRKMGEIPSVFVGAVEKMKIGQVSKPIRAGNGFHVIKLVGTRGDNMKRMVKQYRVRQIVIEPNAMLTDQQALDRLKRIRQLIIDGESFAKLAKGNSQDLRSATNGGDMGWITTAQVPPVFASKLKSLKKDVISKPFRTANGWHLIQVLKTRETDNTKDFLKAQARQIVFHRAFTEKLQLWLQQVRNSVYVKILDPSLSYKEL